MDYPWHHDLAELLEATKPLFPDVALLETTLVLLSPYAVEIRYDDTVEPELEEARAAVDAARSMHALAEQIVAASGSDRGDPSAFSGA